MQMSVYGLNYSKLIIVMSEHLYFSFHAECHHSIAANCMRGMTSLETITGEGENSISRKVCNSPLTSEKNVGGQLTQNFFGEHRA